MLHHCKDLDELKREYRRLTKQFHPDCGGTDEQMKQLNLEFERLYAKLSGEENAAEAAAAYESVMESLLNLDGIIVEVCGSWLWISGNTYQHRDALKAAGCRWASNKKLWYWRSPESTTTSHKAVSMEKIREKYGSEIHRAAAYRPALA